MPIYLLCKQCNIFQAISISSSVRWLQEPKKNQINQKTILQKHRIRCICLQHLVVQLYSPETELSPVQMLIWQLYTTNLPYMYPGLVEPVKLLFCRQSSFSIFKNKYMEIKKYLHIKKFGPLFVFNIKIYMYFLKKKTGLLSIKK